MRNLFHLAWRELTSMFLSPLAYLIMLVFLLWNGWWFRVYLSVTQGAVTETYAILLGNSLIFWIMAIVIPAAITHARIAAEKKSGVLEMTMTAPVSDVEYVLAKFLAPATFWVILWIPTSLYAWFLSEFGQAPEFGRVAAGYLGVFLVGFVFIGVDLLVSAMTTSVIVSLLMAFFLNFALVLVPLGLDFVSQDPSMRKIRNYIDLPQQFQTFSSGVVDSRAIVVYVSTIVLALFLAVRTVEVRKWR